MTTAADVAATQSNGGKPKVEKLMGLPIELRNLISGGLAGMVAKSVVAPIDRIKILYQITATPFHLRHVPNVAYSIAQTEGLSALWKGNFATMLRVFPYSGIQFMVFDRCKMYFLGQHELERLRRRNTRPPSTIKGKMDDDFEDEAVALLARRKTDKFGLSPLESLLSGMVAGTLSVIITYPLDLTRAQLAVLKKEKSSNTTRKTKGFVSVLFGNYRNGVRNWVKLGCIFFVKDKVSPMFTLVIAQSIRLVLNIISFPLFCCYERALWVYIGESHQHCLEYCHTRELHSQ
uniref:ADP,ATP carrier protein n=1 Tax=Ditylum brightwellii TaxID=49249 RepID=A0A6V2HRM5_9STRA